MDVKTCPACRHLNSPDPDKELCPTHAAAHELLRELVETGPWLETIAAEAEALPAGRARARTLVTKIRARARLIEMTISRARLAPRTR